MQTGTQTVTVSKKKLWAGRIISGLAVLFLVFDGVAKVMKVAPVLEACARLGFPQNLVVGIGTVLLACVCRLCNSAYLGSGRDLAEAEHVQDHVT